MFNVKKAEQAPIYILMLMFFCIVGSSITGASARDTFFLTQFDKSLLPLMFSLVAGLMVGVISLYNKLTATLDLLDAIKYSSIFFCITLILIRLNLDGFVIPFFYAWVDVIISITIFQFWLLAGEIFNARQAKRLFSLIGIGGSVAGISAGFLMKPFLNKYGVQDLIIPTVILIALIPFLAQFLKPYRQIDGPIKSNSKIQYNSKKSTEKKLFDPYLKSILLMVCAAAISSRIIEFQFKITAANSYESSTQLAAFFGNYYMYLNGTTLIMQLFLTSFILRKFGVLGGLIVMPVGLIIGTVSFFALANLSSIFIARLFDQTFKFSIQSASTEMLWTTIPKNKARKVKPIIDSSLKSVAEGFAGIIIYFIITTKLISNDQLYLLSAPVIMIIVVWLLNNFRIKQKYVDSIEKAINHRHLNLTDVQFDITDSQILKTIEDALKSRNIHKQTFALDLIKGIRVDSLSETLNEILESGGDEIKKQILHFAYNKKQFINDDILLKLSRQNDQIAAMAISNFNRDQRKKNYNYMLTLLKSNDDHLIASSAIAILKIDFENDKARQTLKDFLNVKNVTQTVIALEYLRDSVTMLTKNNLFDLLYHSSTEISNAALNVAGNRLDEFYLPAIISNLENLKCSPQARNILKLYNEEKVLNELVIQLEDDSSRNDLKIGIIRCMAEYPQQVVINTFKNHLTVKHISLATTISESLLKISKNNSLKYDFEVNFLDHVKLFTKAYFQLHCFEEIMKNFKGNGLIIDQLNFEKRKILYIILKLVTLKIPNSPIDSHIKGLIEKKDKDLPNILEFFDSSFSTEIRALLMPIIDPENGFDKKVVKIEQQKKPLEKWLKDWTESNNSWKSAICTDYMLKNDLDKLIMINWETVTPSPALSQILKNFPNEKSIVPLEKFTNQLEKTMFTILEKTILLKTVDLFQDIPGELLSQVSRISKARSYDSGDIIFVEGDAGDSMFIVFEGIVSIAKGGKEIAELEKGASLGEMALLDNEPRSADAVAKADSILLKINQDVFYELMESNADIMKQIIKLLSSRVRNANAKLEMNL